MEEICVVINAGTVGPGGLIINVENIGGTATGEGGGGDEG